MFDSIKTNSGTRENGDAFTHFNLSLGDGFRQDFHFVVGDDGYVGAVTYSYCGEDQITHEEIDYTPFQ